MLRSYALSVLLFLATSPLAGCSGSTKWISPEELTVSSTPNIREIELTDGLHLIFDDQLGWYDHDGCNCIEGANVQGSPMRVAFERIKMVGIYKASNTPIIVVAIISTLIALLLVALSQARVNL